MVIQKQTLHPQGRLDIDIYPKTSVDQVEGLEDIQTIRKDVSELNSSLGELTTDVNGNTTDIGTLQQSVDSIINSLPSYLLKTEADLEYIKQSTFNLMNGSGIGSIIQKNDLNPNEADDNGSVSFGGGNKAYEQYSMCFGYYCESAQKAVAMNHMCKALGLYSVAMGQFVIVYSPNSISYGLNNTINRSAQFSAIFGSNCEIGVDSASITPNIFGLGVGLKCLNGNKVLLGRYNEDDQDSSVIFEFGTGGGDGSRRSPIKIYSDGKIRNGVNIVDNDNKYVLVNKKYVDDKLLSLRNEILGG